MEASVQEKRIIVLGIGNLLEKDDGIGVYATTYMERNLTCKPHVAFINGGVEGINLLNTFLECDEMTVLDTIMLDDEPGSIYNIPSDKLAGLGVNSGGAHEVGVLQVMEMIELLGHTMPRTHVIGIIPQEITFEIGLSETLSAKAEAFINTAIAHLRESGIEVERKTPEIALETIIEQFRHPELAQTR